MNMWTVLGEKLKVEFVLKFKMISCSVCRFSNSVCIATLCCSTCRPNSEEDDPPVQGPLPFEPDDAPWKKSESGIRKLWVLNFSYVCIVFVFWHVHKDSFTVFIFVGVQHFCTCMTSKQEVLDLLWSCDV